MSVMLASEVTLGRYNVLLDMWSVCRELHGFCVGYLKTFQPNVFHPLLNA